MRQCSLDISKLCWWSRTAESQTKSGSALVSGRKMQLIETRSRWSPELTDDTVGWEWPCLTELCQRGAFWIWLNQNRFSFSASG